jgi:plasmid stabilization system protein ParE
MPRFILSEFVEPELSAIWDYIAIDNLDAADRFLEAAYGTFQELARRTHPEFFPSAAERSTFVSDQRL